MELTKQDIQNILVLISCVPLPNGLGGAEAKLVLELQQKLSIMLVPEPEEGKKK